MSKPILALDYGERRTGVAIGQRLTGTATPIKTLLSKDGKPDWSGLKQLLVEWEPESILVGMPEDTESNKAIRKKITRFCNQLENHTDLPIHTYDESYSSDAAYRNLKEQRQSGRRRIRKEDIDSHAAAILLESWLHTNS